MEEVFVHKDSKSFISYIILDNGIVCLSAHTKDSKYGISFLRKLYKAFMMFKEVVTALPHIYLVEFYSKHFDVVCIDEEKQFYLISSRS